MPVRVTRGTPHHGTNLCHTCAYATYVRGHSISQELIQCSEISFGTKWEHDFVPFPVAECSSYKLRGTLTLGEMKAMAYIIEPASDGIGFTSRRMTKEERYNESY